MEVIAVKDAAERLGISRSTVLRLAASGQLQGRKLPGRTGPFVFDPDVVEQYRRALASITERPRARARRRGQDATRGKETASCPR